MKTPFSYLFALNALSQCALNYQVKAQSFPDNIFQNAGNTTWVFESETSHSFTEDAYCEYDSCHLVLQPGALQWVTYPKENTTDTITYKVCDTEGADAITFVKGNPQCTYYSGAKINVTASLNSITARGINQSVQDVEVYGNQTSYAYRIVVTMLPPSTYYPTSYPSASPTLSPTPFREAQKKIDPIFLALCILGMAAVATFMTLYIRYSLSHKKEKEVFLLENMATEKKSGMAINTSQNFFRRFLMTPAHSHTPPKGNMMI